MRNLSKICIASSLLLPLAASAVQPAMHRTPAAVSTSLPTQRPQAQRQARQQAPARITAGGAAIYGYLGFEYYGSGVSKYFEPKLMEFGPDGTPEEKWIDDAAASEDIPMATGWLKDGVITGMSHTRFNGQEAVVGNIIVNLDFKTGKVINFNFPAKTAPAFNVAAYNESDGYIYGTYFYPGANYQKGYLGKAPVNDLANVTNLGDLTTGNNFLSICYNPEDQMLYGFTIDKEFVKMDSNGNITPIFKSDLNIAPYVSGIVYSPVEKLFYWNYYVDGTYDSYLCTVNPETHEIKTITSFPDEGLYYFLLTTDRAVSATQPKMPELTSVSFEGGSTTGTVTFRMPAENGNGSALSGELDWEVAVDGVKAASGKAEAGSEVKATVSDVSTGLRHITVTASSGGVSSPEASESLWVGNDTPENPTGVTLTETSLTWEPVTKGVHDGWIDLPNLQYEVALNGTVLGTTSGNSYEIQIPDVTVTRWKATVTAVSHELRSEAIESNAIVAGNPLSLPVYFKPLYDDINIMATTDGNADGNCWGYNPKNRAFAVGYALGDKPADDWLFLPATTFNDPDAYYSISFMSKLASQAYLDERLGVWLCKEQNPEAATVEIMPLFTPTIDFNYNESTFQVPEAGTWYIAFHCASAPMQNGVMINEINISDRGIRAASPAAPTELSAKAAPKGELRATVEFSFPTSDMTGNALPADARLKATVKGADTATVEGLPGERGKAEVATTSGMNVIEVTAELDGKTGAPADISVWCGIDIPGLASGLREEYSDNLMEATITWNAPTEGINGGYVVPEEMTYTIYRYDNTPLGPTWVKIDETGKERSYTYTVEAGAPQEMVRLGVMAYNEAGHDPHVAIIDIILGTPYDLPVEEDFAKYTNDFSLKTWVMLSPDASYDAEWEVTEAESVFSGCGMRGYVLCAEGAPGTKGMINMPAITTEGFENVELIMNSARGTGSADIEVYAQACGMDAPKYIGVTTTKSNAPASDYAAHFMNDVFPLPAEFCGKGWVRLSLVPIFTSDADQAVIRKVEVQEGNGVQGVSTDGSARILAVGDGILVLGAEGETVTVADLSGRVVALEGSAPAELRIRLEPGIYIVKTGDKAVKIAL